MIVEKRGQIIIAAFAARGLSETIMEVCLSEHEIVLGDDLFDEILRNIRHKIKLPPGVVDNIGAFLREHSTISIPVPLASDVCRDPDDVKVLGLAVASNADYIFTGDKDLLVLKSFQEIQILNPRSFSDILHSGEK